eukprot:7387713-Pyramimonas_sp.AAC.1
MAMEICDQAFRQRQSYRMRYWAWLRMLEARDNDEWVCQLAEHAEAIARESEGLDNGRGIRHVMNHTELEFNSGECEASHT